MTSKNPERRNVQVSEDELTELRKIAKMVLDRKEKGKGRRTATKELIKRHQPEYDLLKKQYGDKSE